MWRGRTNRYANKRKHKRKLKQRHAMMCDGARTNLDLVRQRYQDERDTFPWWEKHHPRNGGTESWCQVDLSGPRPYSKDATTIVIQSSYRDRL